MIRHLAVQTAGQGLHEFTEAVEQAVRGANLADAEGRLALGAWQGIYLWEHRRRGSRRSVVLHIGT